MSGASDESRQIARLEQRIQKLEYNERMRNWAAAEAEEQGVPSVADLLVRIQALEAAARAFVRDVELANTHKNHQAICDLNEVLGHTTRKTDE